jgi:hypothetical protein
LAAAAAELMLTTVVVMPDTGRWASSPPAPAGNLILQVPFLNFLETCDRGMIFNTVSTRIKVKNNPNTDDNEFFHTDAHKILLENFQHALACGILK